MDRSFEEVVRRISPTLKRITYRLNGHFSFFNDQDLFQESLVYLWDCFKDGRLQDKTDSYILQGCFFHLKNYLRKTADRASLISLNRLCDEEEPGLEDKISSRYPDSCVELLDNAMELEQIMTALTARERQVLSLCLDGLTVREIGKRLGISHVMVVKIKAAVRKKAACVLDK